MDDQLTCCLVNWTSNQKTYQKTHFPDLLHQKKFRAKFFWVNSPNTWVGGNGFLGHRHPKHTSLLSPSFAAARGRCIDLELAARLASPTSTIAEL